MSSKQLKSENEEVIPAVSGEKAQDVPVDQGQVAPKSKGFNKKNIALISVFAFLVVGGIVGGLVYYFIEEYPVKYREGRIQDFETTGRECLVVSQEDNNKQISNKTEQCANKKVYSQVVTLHVSNTSVTKVLVINKIDYQFDNGTNFTLPGINLTDFNTTTMRFLQANDNPDNPTGDINQVPNAVIVTDKNDTVKGVGFPNNTDSNYRTAILQQVYNVQIDPADNSTGTLSIDTPQKRIRILQSDENTNKGSGPFVNASQHASLDSNGNVNQSNITQSQQITQQNSDNSTTTISGNSTSTLTLTQQNQASNDTMSGIQQLTAKQNITYYSPENYSEAILPTSNQTKNTQTSSNQTNSSQDNQNPADQASQESDNQIATNQTSPDSSNQTLSQEGNTSQDSNNRILQSTPQQVILGQFSKNLISVDFLGINFNAMADASAKLNVRTLTLNFINYCIVNNQRIVLIEGAFSISTGFKPYIKNFGKCIDQNLINQVYLVFGYPIFLSVDSAICYGYSLQLISPTQTQLLASFQPYANYQLNAQAYASFFVIEVGVQARGELAKVSASFTVHANLVSRQSTANAIATFSSSLNLRGYYDYIRCEIRWRKVCFCWRRCCIRYPYISCAKSGSKTLFNINLCSSSKSLAIYSRTISW